MTPEEKEAYEWISVKDRLPSTPMRVLVSTKTRLVGISSVYIAYWDGAIWELEGNKYTVWITHWMPLPEPPEK